MLGAVLKDSNVVSLQINTAGIMVKDRMVRNALVTNRTYVRVCAGVQATTDCNFGFAVGSLGELALPELALVFFVFLPEDISISLPELSGCNS